MTGESWEARTQSHGAAHRRTDASELCCSFCGKRRDAVASMVAGPTRSVAICNECVELCAEIIAEPDVG